jgi:hypothetical protein
MPSSIALWDVTQCCLVGFYPYCGGKSCLHLHCVRKCKHGFEASVTFCDTDIKVKVIPQQAEVAQGVPGRLRHRIVLTFGTTRVVGRQPYVPAAFTPGETPGTHFQKVTRSQGTWFRRKPRKKIPSDTTGNRSRDLPCLNHYATPGPDTDVRKLIYL